MPTAERFQQIQELFHAALKLPAAERQAFLNARCGQDQSLRQEVESLLAEDANAFDFLKTDLGASRISLPIGTRLGPYEISGAIGAGGMGDVYRARDTRLHRDVAIKVLPEGFASNPERISRFQREAQLLAALNHPHIAAIYGLEESNSGLALVIELVEGPTLAERMAQGPIATGQALEIAKQIAEAFEAAHERGIVHRDLKPANVKITNEGAVKVLDFGLGKALSTGSGSGDPGSSQTATLARTQAGMILGTAAYMSPEQARGAAVDKRADIWAFGVVLYEMLTGERLFPGDTISDTVAAVLTKEPDWNRVPANVQRLLRRCLEKDPKRRLRDIADAWALLDEGRQAPAANSRAPWAIAAAMAVALAFASWIAWRATRPIQAPLQPLVRLDVDLGSDVSLGSERGASVILSPDGTRLVYVSHGARIQPRLFSRKLDETRAVEMPGTEDAYAPFFSPDGQWVAFFAEGKLKKVSVQGGPPIALCRAPIGCGGGWGEDGNIVVAQDISALSRIPSSGGVPEKITELAPGESSHRWPQILPGGQAVLFSSYASMSGVEGTNIEVLSLRDRRRKTLQRGGSWGRYVPSGHLVYMNHGTLLAVPFDPDRLEVRGSPHPMLEGIAYSMATGAAQLDFSEAGTVVYRSGGAIGGLVTVQLLEASGKTSPLLATPGHYMSPAMSPDGSRLALTSAGDIWIYEPRRDSMMRLTFTGGYSNPHWTPDGRYLVFFGAEGISWTRADGTGNPQPLLQSKNNPNAWSFTPDGKRLAFVQFDAASGADIWTVPVESDGGGLRAGKPEAFLQTQFNERGPAFSPDGRWLAYLSDESGSLQVYVRAFPDRSHKIRVSSSESSPPLWSPSGRELFFINMDQQIMVAACRIEGDSLLAEKPRLWSERRLANVAPPWSYAVAPDGKGMVALMPADAPEQEAAQHHVNFLLNFFDELRRRVPTRP